MTDYENNKNEKDALKKSATLFATMKLNPASDLKEVRDALAKNSEENPNRPKLLSDWCFLEGK